MVQPPACHGEEDRDDEEELAKIEEGLEKFEILSKERGVSHTNDPRRTSLLRIKIKDSAMLASDEEEVREPVFLQRVQKGLVSRCSRRFIPVWSSIWTS